MITKPIYISETYRLHVFAIDGGKTRYWLERRYAAGGKKGKYVWHTIGTADIPKDAPTVAEDANQ